MNRIKKHLTRLLFALALSHLSADPVVVNHHHHHHYHISTLAVEAPVSLQKVASSKDGE